MSHESSTVAQPLRVLIVSSYIFYWLSYLYLSSPSYFDYQGTSKDCKVTLATFHLEGEANQWWQWMKKVYCKERIEVTWENF